jgi:outer membrane protein assembly factor BamB
VRGGRSSSRHAAAGLFVLLAFGLIACRPAHPGSPLPIATPSPASANAPTATSAPDRRALTWPEARAHVGQVVSVEGIIERTNRSPRGRVFLDFNRDPDAPDAFGLIIDPENLDRFPSNPESFYLNRRVRVTGQVVTFDGHAEMHPRSADDIQVEDLDAQAGAIGAPTPPALRLGFPEATVTVVQGQVRLWSTWPMEGRDPQRSSRADVRGPDTHALALSVEIPTPSFGQVVQAADGTSYVSLQDGGVVAVSSGGQIRWRFTPPVDGPSPTPAVGPDGTIYVRAADGTVYALKPDGTRRWTTDIGSNQRRLGPAILVGADSYLYTTSYTSTQAFKLQPGGFFEWGHELQARTLAGAAVTTEGVVYAGGDDGTFRAIDPDGFERWTTRVDGPVVGPPSADLQGRAYVLVGGQQPHLVALDAAGRTRWRAAPCWHAGAPIQWTALGTTGRVQVGNCAIDDKGAEAWHTDVDQPSTPAIVDADGTTYFAAGARLYAVDPAGKPRWTFDAESVLNPPSIGPGGNVLVTSSRRLYVIGAQSRP